MLILVFKKIYRQNIFVSLTASYDDFKLIISLPEYSYHYIFLIYFLHTNLTIRRTF